MLEAGPVYEALSLPPTHQFKPQTNGHEAHKVGFCSTPTADVVA